MLAAVRPPEPSQYDAFADGYLDHAATAPYNARYDRPATLALLGDVAGRTVLDAGCGPGLYLTELVDRGASVIGCDAAPRMIALARERVGPRAELVVHDLERPFTWLADGAVDLVVSALVHHHLTDRCAFLREMHRVLTPDGALVISTHHPTDDWVRLGGSYFAVEPVTETWSRGWDVTSWRLPLGLLAEEFAEAGFLIERLVEPSPDPSMAESHPEAFEKLSNRPGFVLFRLVPRPALSAPAP